MAKTKVKPKSMKSTTNRPHPMSRRPGVGRGKGYKCGGKLEK